MAEKQFGGEVVVQMEAIFKHIAQKVHDDITCLHKMIETHDGLHDFTESQRLLTEIHAGVRATNILDGKVNATGETLPLPAPATKVTIDMGALGAAIDPKTVTTNQLTDTQKAA